MNTPTDFTPEINGMLADLEYALTLLSAGLLIIFGACLLFGLIRLAMSANFDTKMKRNLGRSLR